MNKSVSDIQRSISNMAQRIWELRDDLTNIVEWRPGDPVQKDVFYLVAAHHQFHAQDSIPGPFWVCRWLQG